MIHTDVQERLFLYLDGDLPAEEIRLIREHLAGCSVCSRQHDRLAATWHPVSPQERPQPSPFLWTRIQARIGDREVSPSFLWWPREALRMFRAHPLVVPVAVAALVAGLYVGTPPAPDEQSAPRPAGSTAGFADELGLDHFDVVPPTALGRTLTEGPHTQR
jgi:anti-sigma factor RsiW